MESKVMQPTRKRHVVLDAMRGFAILGICIANYPEFGLWTFLSGAQQAAIPGAGADRTVRFLEYLLVDGKFYTLFSLLFGIGFSLILRSAARKGANGRGIFLRRMCILILIGLCHLLFLWSGDILFLYGVLGLFLPLFWKMSDRGVLISAGVLLMLPIAAEAARAIFHYDPGLPLSELQWSLCGKYGITADNFAFWLQQSGSYKQISHFLMQGAVERMWEFVEGSRYFRVLGLFLVGLVIGRSDFYAKLDSYKGLLTKCARTGFAAGLPISFLYAWSCMEGEPWGAVVHSVIYTLSVFPLGAAFFAGFHLLYLKSPELKIFTVLAAPGRMALTNYILQSVFGMLIFYGTGLALGTKTSLLLILAVSLGVYALEVLLSRLWFRYFRFGPLEWIWRMLTYGSYLPIREREK